MLKDFTIANLLDLNETIAGELFEGKTYPWEALPKISDFIKKLGPTLDPEVYEQRGENIWVAKSATVAPTAFLNGPLIIDEDAEIRHCAFIRGNAIVGKGSVVGNSTELKNVVIFNSVQVPHYNYVGDSILGYKSQLHQYLADSFISMLFLIRKSLSDLLCSDIPFIFQDFSNSQIRSHF